MLPLASVPASNSSFSPSTLFRWSSRLLDYGQSPHTTVRLHFVHLHSHHLMHLIRPGVSRYVSTFAIFPPAMSGYKNIPQKVVGLEEYLTGRVLATAAVLLSCAGSLGASTAHGMCVQLQRTCELSGSSSSQHTASPQRAPGGGAHLLNDRTAHALLKKFPLF